MTPKLVIFDVDGTLIDSQAHITTSMALAFERVGLAPPSRSEVMSIIGLSLPQAIANLAPDDADKVEALVAAYKDAFVSLREQEGGAALSPLFSGARETLKSLHGSPDILLAIATGKSRRGMEHILDLHDLRPLFLSVQVADDHPSKPHPSMITACLRDTGVEQGNAVILGDTTFDMEMGRAAGIRCIGVSWGYHPSDHLLKAGAETVLDRFDALPATLDRIFAAS